MKRARSSGRYDAKCRVALTLLTSISFVLINSVPAVPQTETGQIVVKTVDSQGATVPGATLAVKSVDTGRSLPTVTTNDAGSATMANLQPGIYDVNVNSYDL